MNPHLNQPVHVRGAPLAQCQGAALMMHGRGQSPEDILTLVDRIRLPSFAYLAAAAAGGSWYPARFMEPIAANEPYLSYALDAFDQRVNDLLNVGIPKAKMVLIGFSQGACLTAEYAVRHPARFGGVMLFTGGLIGPLGTRWDVPGSFDGTPVFLGSSDVDAWVPLERVQESTAVFTKMGADVIERIYPGMDHLVNDDEIAVARHIMHNRHYAE